MYKLRYIDSPVIPAIFAVMLLIAAAPVPAAADPQSVIKDLAQAYVKLPKEYLRRWCV